MPARAERAGTSGSPGGTPGTPGVDLVLDALGDATRRALLARLRNGPATVGALAATVPVSRPAVSQHLRVLRASGLVDFDEQGTRNVYRLDARGLAEARAFLDDLWGHALGAFEEHVRRRHEERMT